MVRGGRTGHHRTHADPSELRRLAVAQVAEGDRAAADRLVGQAGAAVRELVAARSNLSYRLARCCFTAASLTTSSAAISLMEAGSVNRSRSSSGRHSTTSTSRSRAVSAGGAVLALGPRGAGVGRAAEQQARPPDADLVAVAQPLLGPDALAVQERAVRRAEVGHAPALAELARARRAAGSPWGRRARCRCRSPLPTVTRSPASSTRRTPSSAQTSTVAPSIAPERRDSPAPTMRLIEGEVDDRSCCGAGTSSSRWSARAARAGSSRRSTTSTTASSPSRCGAVRSEADRDALLAEAGILLGLPPNPHLPLVREDFFDGDDYVIAMDWVEGTDLGRILHTEGRPGLPPDARPRLAGRRRRRAHPPPHPGPAGHPRRRQAGQPRPHQGRAGRRWSTSAPRRRRSRPAGAAARPGYAAPERSTAARAPAPRDIYSLAATAFALLTGEPPTGIRPAWEGIDPELAAQLEDGHPRGAGHRPGPPAGHPGRARRAAAGRVGALAADRRAHVLLHRHRGLDRPVGGAAGGDVAGARAARQDRSPPRSSAAAAASSTSMGEGDSTVSVFDSPAAAVVAAIDLTRDLAGGDVAAGGDDPGAGRPAHRRGRAARRRLLRPHHEHGRPAPRAGRRRPGLPVEGHRRAGARPPAAPTRPRRPRPDPAPGTERARAGVRPLGARRRRAAARHRVPLPRPLAFGPDDADRYFGRDAVVADLVERLRRHPSSPSSARRAAASRACCGPASVPGWDDRRRRHHPRDHAHPRRASTATPTACSSSTSSRSCSPRSTRPATAPRSSTPSSASTGRWRWRCGPTSTGRAPPTASWPPRSPATRCCSGPWRPTSCAPPSSSPPRGAGLRVEPGLVELLVSEVEGEPGALPLLAHALRATWEERDGRTLTLDAYRATGGVTGAIGSTADQVLAGFDDTDRDIAQQLLLRLVEPGDGHRRHPPAGDAHRAASGRRPRRPRRPRRRRPGRGAAGGDRRGHGAGGARGAHPRVAATADVAGRPARRPAGPAPGDHGRRGVDGRRPRAQRALPRSPPGPRPRVARPPPPGVGGRGGVPARERGRGAARPAGAGPRQPAAAHVARSAWRSRSCWP